MGCGCVLLLWGIVACGGAAIIGIVVVPVGPPQQQGPLWSRIAESAGCFLVPFVYVGYFGVAFLLYAVVNGLRGYDPGIGDMFNVPLAGSYGLVCIDSPDQCFLEDGDYRQAVTQIGRTRNFVFAKSDTGQYIGIRTSDDRRWVFADAQSLRTKMRAAGAKEVDLEDVGSFYSHNRWGAFDVVAVVVILAGAVALPFVGIGLWDRWSSRGAPT